jgi:hypothetical protein
MKFSWKNIENWQSWKMRFFWVGHFDFFFFLLHLNEDKQPVHMRYHLFLHYGWFLQNLGKFNFFSYFLMDRGQDRELKTGICKNLTRKPRYSSFFSAWCTDFKNVNFEKIHWAPSEVIKVKRSFSRSLRPNFGFHLVFTSFHLEFSSFWVLRLFDFGDLGDLRRGSGNFFKNYIFEIIAFQGKRWCMFWLSSQNFH